ncbi:GerAB/ArcD/ProY family transporter [Halalkalibacter lacteus]|uniref:GerAB/ArcD/ProY family transporter n=1 Tax=Halalkalibacter lacteus TaxID=3090663 RepID=UPI002FC61EC3
MEKVKISSYQFFSLMMLFQLGTAVVVGFGVNAKKDAWLAIFLGMIIGLVLYYIYYYLFMLYLKPLTSYVQDILGKYLGLLIGILYITYFLYGAARDLRDVGGLLVTSVYNQTPMIVIMMLMVLAIAYVLYKGMLILGRLSEIYFIVMILLGMFGNAFVLLSGIVDVTKLLPVLGEGWKPVLKTVFPLTSVFPWGEVICFSFILPYLQYKEKALKLGASSIVLSSFILMYTTSLNVTVLGAGLVETSTFPLFITVSLVNIYEFIQRIDAIVVLTLFIGAFFKTAIFYYAAIIGAADLFRVDYKKLVLPFGIIVLFLAVIIAKDYSEHIEEGQASLLTIHGLFAVYIPVALLLIVFLKKLFKKENSEINQTT